MPTLGPRWRSCQYWRTISCRCPLRPLGARRRRRAGPDSEASEGLSPRHTAWSASKCPTATPFYCIQFRTIMIESIWKSTIVLHECLLLYLCEATAGGVYWDRRNWSRRSRRYGLIIMSSLWGRGNGVLEGAAASPQRAALKRWRGCPPSRCWSRFGWIWSINSSLSNTWVDNLR